MEENMAGKHARPSDAAQAMEQVLSVLDASGKADASNTAIEVTGEMGADCTGADQAFLTSVNVNGKWYRLVLATATEEEAEMLG